uniref:Ankyrin repeat and LEM domain-containing protein 2-like n=1 Tax=Saccoglossus kowalevskii TaxID=10224 RepID=A0ABM0GS66_SACKO|nr:PREDICTED: ankyrin repeat and LEM domain-containing protein 2-like [Saccoglossus kowalevskii]
MEDIRKGLSKLSVKELQDQLRQNSLPSGPITNTTRSLFERKLANCLLQSRGAIEDSQCPSFGGDSTDSGLLNIQVQSEHSVTGSSGDQEPGTSSDTVSTTQINCVSGDDGHLSATDDSTNEKPPTSFYAVCFPRGCVDEVDGSNDIAVDHVYTDRNEALQIVKRNKGSRFKVFKQKVDAVAFCKCEAGIQSTPTKVIPAVTKASEKANEFKGPKMPELVSLRKAIEHNDKDKVTDLIWKNPRYLISAGDTPVLLQNCETPLHFASKFGSVEVVEILVSHPGVDKTVKNRNGETASQIAGSRCDVDGVKEKIRALLNEQCFVPLWRSEDNATDAVIGEPWSPDPSGLDQSSPLLPRTTSSPIDPVVTMRAYAGPMPSSQANNFYKSWITPPRSERRKAINIKRSDSDKGLERLGRDLASSMDVPWVEFWPFLDCYINLSSLEGLGTLERYLENRSREMTQDDDSCMVSNNKDLTPSPEILHAESVMKSLSESLELMQVSESDIESKHLEYKQTAEVSDCGSDKDATDSKYHQSDSKTDELKEPCIEYPFGNVINIEKSSTPQYTDDFLKADKLWTEWREADASINDSTSTGSSDTFFDALSEWTGFDESTDDSGSEIYHDAVSDMVSPQMTERYDVSEQSLVEAFSKLKLGSPFGNKLTDLAHVPSNKADAVDRNTRNVNVPGDTGSEITIDISSPAKRLMKPTNGNPSEVGKDTMHENSDIRSERKEVAECSPPHTAPTLNIEDFTTPQSSRRNITSHHGKTKVFLQGSSPSKLDLDVLRAIEKLEITDNYPLVKQWKHMVTSFPTETQNSWSSPAPTRAVRSSRSVSQSKFAVSPRSLLSPMRYWNNSPLSQFRLRHLSDPVQKMGLQRQQKSVQTNLVKSFGE